MLNQKISFIISAIILTIFYKIYKSRCIYDVSCHHYTRKTFMCKITPGQHMLFVLNQKISFIIQLLWHQLNQKLTFFMLNGGNGIRKEVCTVSRFLFMFPWHFINGIFIIYIVDQSICFEQLKYGIMCVCVPWQVKFWLRLFARFLRHVWHQKHENFVVLVLVTWQYLVFKSSLFVYWSYGKDISFYVKQWYIYT